MSDPSQDERLPTRLNAEPAVFKGCSTSELAAFAAASAVVWLPFGIAISWLAGALTMGFGVAGAGIVATVVALASLFQRLKRNRPDGYYKFRARIWLAERRLVKAPMVLESQSWTLGRTRRA